MSPDRSANRHPWNQDASFGGVNTRGHGRRLAIVATQGTTRTRSSGRDFTQHIQATVTRSVVDVDNLCHAPKLRERLVQLFMQRAEVWFFIKGGRKIEISGG